MAPALPATSGFTALLCAGDPCTLNRKHLVRLDNAERRERVRVVKYSFKELVDVKKLQELTDALHAATGIPSAIITMDGEVLTGSGWQRICTEFHRKHPDIERECIKSDTALHQSVSDGQPYAMYKCPRGLVDACSPVVIEGTHMANVFAGQLFTEAPSESTEQEFREQAREFSLNEEAYIRAFREIPVMPEEKFRSALSFLAKLTEIVASIGLTRMRELEAGEQRRTSAERYKLLTETSLDGFWLVDVDGRILEVNDAYCGMSGYSRDELTAMLIWELEAVGNNEEALRHIALAKERGSEVFESLHRRKDGTVFDVEIKVMLERDSGRLVGFLRDISSRKRAEEKYRVVAENTYDWEFWADPDGKFAYVSPSCLRISGHTADEFIADPGLMEKIIHPEDLGAYRVHVHQAAAVHHPGEVVFRVIRPDGHVRWIEHICQPVVSDHGVFMGNRGSNRDVSQRHRAEEALRESEALLRQSQRVAGVGHYVYDIPAGLWVSSEVLDDIFGIDAAYVRDVPGWLAIIDVGHQQEMARYLAEHVIRDRLPFDKEYRIKRVNDKVTRWVHGLGNLEFDDQGRPVRMFGTIQDITDRKQSDQALRESEERFFKAFNTSGVVMSITSLTDGRYLDVNDSFCSTFGYCKEDLVGQRAFSQQIIQDPEARDNFLRQVSENGKVQNVEMVVRTRNGDFREGLFTGVVFDLGAERCLLTSMVDITERTRAEDKLRLERALLSNITDTSPVGIVTVDRDGQISFANPQAEKILGLSRSKLTQRYFNSPEWKITALDGGPFPESQLPFSIVMATGNPVYNIEHAIEWPDGRRILLSVNAAPQRDGKGRLEGMVSVIQDITEQKKAEEEVRRSNDELSAVFRALPDLYFKMSKDGTILDYKSGESKDLYTRPEQFLGFRMPEVLPPEVGALFEAAIGRVARSGREETIEYELELPHGKNAFEGRIYPLGEDQVIAFVRNITERKQSEEKLRRKTEELDRFFEIGLDLLCIADTTGRFLRLNPSWESVLGYQRTELEGRMFIDLVHPDDKEATLHAVRELAAGRDVVNFVNRYQCRDGSYRWIEWRASPFEGRLIYAAARDITDRKLQEARRLELERQMFHTQKLESLGVLAGGIAHDFNNLLTAIAGNLDLALQRMPTSGARANVLRAVNATHKAADLTREMLAYSGRGRFDVSVFDLRDMIRENIDLFRAAVPRTITFNSRASEQEVIVEADSAQLQQVVMNLITNAAEAIGEGAGIITLATSIVHCDEIVLSQSRLPEKPAAGSFACLEIADTGSGMSPETQERIFEPFFTTKFTGRGLGMAAVLGIVKGHKGAIFVESSEGKGTAIRVLLPLGEIKERRSVPESAPAPDISVHAHRNEILVVDDEEIVRELCLDFVNELGFTGLAVSDGEEAVQAFRQRSGTIACVLLDLTMPRMDGVATFKELVRIQPDVKVILSSGFDEQEVVHRFGSQGLAGFIQKPYKLEVLKEMVARVLQ
jgi:PAS domain S-box-containing protein